MFKQLSTKKAKEPASSHSPSEAAPSSIRSTQNSNRPERFYELLLENCERLFDNEIEPPMFEDQMRSIFGIQDAYKSFTIDKVIGAIIKQVKRVALAPHIWW